MNKIDIKSIIKVYKYIFLIINLFITGMFIYFLKIYQIEIDSAFVIMFTILMIMAQIDLVFYGICSILINRKRMIKIIILITIHLLTIIISFLMFNIVINDPFSIAIVAIITVFLIWPFSWMKHDLI